MKQFDISPNSDDVLEEVNKLLDDYVMVKVDYLNGDGEDFIERHAPVTALDFTLLNEGICPLCNEDLEGNICEQCESEFVGM